MTLMALILALFVGLFGLGFIIMDMERRELPKRTLVLWGCCASSGIAAGFLIPYLHDGVYNAAFELLYDTPDNVVLTPIQQDMPILFVGLLTTILVGIVYGTGSRMTPLLTN